MDKIYQLLRNNQQSGPFTKEELIGLGLKPFDLIWANGITAGWMYPLEIEALKAYVAEPIPAPVAVVETKEAEPVSFPDTAPIVSTTISDQPVRTLPGGKHIFISLPGGTMAEKMGTQKKAPTQEPVATEETPEQKLERKALELRQKVQAFAEAKKVEGAEPTLDTKYARSLEDIKEEYTHWMRDQKGKGRWRPSFRKKQVFTAAAVVLVAALGYTTSKWLFSPDKAGTAPAMGQPQTMLPLPAAGAPQTTGVPENQSVINTEYTGHHLETLNDLEEANKLIEKDLERFDRTQKAVTHSPIKNDTWEEESDPTYETTEESYPDADEPATPTTRRTTEPPARTVSNRSEKATVPLNQQIDVKASYLKAPKAKGLAGLQLTLQNNSSQVLKTVAIDVFYYRDDNRQLAKETVYFNGVHPGEALTLTAPGNKKAASATYQLGLISTDGGLYVAKQ